MRLIITFINVWGQPPYENLPGVSLFGGGGNEGFPVAFVHNEPPEQVIG